MTEFGSCVVAGGGGQVGRMFTALLTAAGAKVISVDQQRPASPVPGGVRWLAGDIRHPDGEVADAVAAADMVLLAVPEPVALVAVNQVGALLQPNALWADTLSVKSRIAAAVTDRLADRHVAAVSVNPMFAPSLGPTGRVIAFVTLIDGPPARTLRELLHRAGADVVDVTAADHDRITAVSQAATHAAVLAFGLTVAELGVDVGRLRKLAPPPHQAMLALLARIASGTDEVYWDIQAGNPRASMARAALCRGAERLAGLSSARQFSAITEEIRDYLGAEDLASLAGACATLFGALGPPKGH